MGREARGSRARDHIKVLLGAWDAAQPLGCLPRSTEPWVPPPALYEPGMVVQPVIPELRRGSRDIEVR